MQHLNKSQQQELVLVNPEFQDLHIVQEENSHLRLFLICIPTPLGLCPASSPFAYDITVEQNGVGCSTEIYALAYGRQQDAVRIHTHVFHNACEGTSRQMLQFVLNDEAQGDFYGELKIMPHAQRVDALQTNRNLLLSDDALMRTRPQLEIYADDVKANHGATTGQLDESALFYMQQRGIGYHQARQMLIAAFMKQVLAPMSDESQKEFLFDAIDRIVH